MASEDSGSGFDPFETLKGAGKLAIDLLQAPSRAVGGTIAAVKEDGFQPLDLGIGLTRSFNDDYDPSKVVGTDDTFLGALATDIALDPLTWISGGLYGAAKGAATGAVKGGAKGLPKLAASLADDAAKSEAKRSTSKVFPELEATRRNTKLDDVPLNQGDSVDLPKITSKGKSKIAKLSRNLDDKDIRAMASRAPKARGTSADSPIWKPIKSRPLSKAESDEFLKPKPFQETREPFPFGGVPKSKADELVDESFANFSKAKQNMNSAIANASDSLLPYYFLTNPRLAFRPELQDDVFKTIKAETQRMQQLRTAGRQVQKRQPEEFVDLSAKTNSEVGPQFPLMTREPTPYELIKQRQQLSRSGKLNQKLRQNVDQKTKAETLASLMGAGIDDFAAGGKQLSKAVRRSERASNPELTKQFGKFQKGQVARGESRRLMTKAQERQARLIGEEIKNAPDDIVQARLSLLKPFGINIPGVSDLFSFNVGKSFSKKAVREAVAKRSPKLDAALRTLENTFIPGAGVPVALSNAERAAGNIANTQAEIAIARLQDLVKTKKLTTEDIEQGSRIRDFSQKLEIDLNNAKQISALRKSDLEDAKAFIKEWDSSSQGTKEILQDLQKQYRINAAQDVRDGIIDKARNQYFPTPRKLDQKLEVPEIGIRSTERNIAREQGFQQARKGDPGAETLDFLQSHIVYEGQRATARQAKNLATAIETNFGKQFANADEAASQGFVKSENTQLNRFFGDDIYVPQEIADGLNRFHKIWTSTVGLSNFTRKFSQLNGAFKSLAYTSNPGHFAVDSIGDTWNMDLAGIPILNAAKTNRSIPIINKMAKRIAGDIDNEIVTIRGQKYEIDELIDMASAKGLLNFGRSADRSGRAQNITGDYFGGTPRKYSPRRGARKYTDWMQSLGNWRDNRFRLTGNLNQLQKNIDDGMDRMAALHHAADKVRIAVFDYNDLTAIEKRIFRNWIPFYTWTRKNIPYQLRSLAKAPGKVMLPFNVQEALLESSDVNEGLIPQYIRNQQFLLPESISSKIPILGDNPLFVNPMIPSMDLGRFQSYRVKGEEGVVPGLDLLEPIGMLTPYVKAPFELASGKEFYTDQQISDPLSYALRTFGGQPGAQLIRQFDNPSELYDRGPAGRTDRQVLGLTGQVLGLRGYSYNEPALRAQAQYRLADIASRLAQEKEKRDRQTKIPFLNIGLPGY